jgi:hypothetical protein
LVELAIVKVVVLARSIEKYERLRAYERVYDEERAGSPRGRGRLEETGNSDTDKNDEHRL